MVSEVLPFPCCLESWILACELPDCDFDYGGPEDENKVLPKLDFRPFYCVFREDDSKLALYCKEEDSRVEPRPKILYICRLNHFRPSTPNSDGVEENSFNGPSTVESPIIASYLKKTPNQYNQGRQFRRKNLRQAKQEARERSKSTVCLAEELPAEPLYSKGKYSSHPADLEVIANGKSKPNRPKSGKSHSFLGKRSFSLSRFFRRPWKSRDLLSEEDEDIGRHKPEEPPFGRTYLSSTNIIGEGGSFSFLLGERIRDTKDASKNPSMMDRNSTLMMPSLEWIPSWARQTGPSLMVNSECLQRSCDDLAATEMGGSNALGPPTSLQQRRMALRKRLLSRSQQPLIDLAPPRPLEIDIKARGLEFGRLHCSLVGGLENCLFIKSQTGTMTVLATATREERDYWFTCLKRTAKPNLENERHRENSLFLSILEAKGLHNKRRYYCDVCLDRTLYARTTSKQSASNSIFWAEEFDLNNLPDVSILTIGLYREADISAKDGRRGLLARSNSKKSSKKSQNRLVGFVTVPVNSVCTRNPSQTWLTLQPPASAESVYPSLLSPTSEATNASTNQASAQGGTGIQLRVSVRYKSVDILPINAYLPLHAMVRENGIEMTEWFEHQIPLKLKEEVASCLVNLHESAGTAASFLTDLVVREVSNLENESMTFRSNTMATKAVESYIKLVGREYLHNLLYRFIQRVLMCPDTWEVDQDKLPPSSLSGGSLLSPDGCGTAASAALIIQEYCARKQSQPLGAAVEHLGGGLSRLAVLASGRVAPPGSLVYSQTQLLHHLDLVWEAVCASLPDFPKPLLEVFSSFRAALESVKGAEFCDKLISACIFLRFVCPAILTPSLFGLASTFPGESSCQRNLTLVAKSLQSLANLSTFGDKESFMRFMNAYVETQIPVMRTFLRDISSLPGVPERRCGGDDFLASPVASNIDCGYELACLQTICQELFATSSSPPSTSGGGSSAFPALNGGSAMSSLPPSLSRLPEVINRLSNLKNGSTTETEYSNSHQTSDSAYASVDSNKNLPAPSIKTTKTSLPRFYLSMEESMGGFPASMEPQQQQSNPVLNPLASPIQKPKAVRPNTVRVPAVTGNDVKPRKSYHQSQLSSPEVLASPRTRVLGINEVDEATKVKELINNSTFVCDSDATGGVNNIQAVDVDYDDPYIDEAYDSNHALRRRTIYDAPYEEVERREKNAQTSSRGVSPVHSIKFPSPPSAFSLYRRPPASTPTSSSGQTFSEIHSEEAPAVSNTVPLQPRHTVSSNAVSMSFYASPSRSSNHWSLQQHPSYGKGVPKTSSIGTGGSQTFENLILEPQPNPIITHVKSHLSRSSTTSSSSGLSSLTSRRGGPNASQLRHPCRPTPSNVGLPASAAAAAGAQLLQGWRADEPMSYSVDGNLFHGDYGFENEYVSTPVVEHHTARKEAEKEDRTSLPVRGIRNPPSVPQPFLTENEQLLTSTLEELGDAVAWLERERNDLLSMQEQRMTGSRPRSRPANSTCGVGPQILPVRALNVVPPTASANVLSPSHSSASVVRSSQLIHPHTSTPSLHWLNCGVNPAEDTSLLTKSTNSLIEQSVPKYTHNRSAVSKTFTLNRPGSASSPNQRSRENSVASELNSNSANNSLQARRQRMTTLVLNRSELTNGAYDTGARAPSGMRLNTNLTDEECRTPTHPYRSRPHGASYVSTSSCNLFTSSNPPVHQMGNSRATSPSNTSVEIPRPQRRTSGDVFILSGSSLTS